MAVRIPPYWQDCHNRWVTPYDAIVLAGGGSTRLGTDKTQVRIDGRTVLERVLDAVGDAAQRIVVGAERTGLDAGLVWMREDPPGSGPANGVACAVSRARSAYVVVLAGDLPYVDSGTVGRLLDAAGSGGAAALRDADGRAQWLCAATRTSALRDRLATRESWADAAMRDLLAPLAPVLVEARGDETHDIDTPEDIPSQP